MTLHLYFVKKYLMITLVTFSIMLLVTFLIDLVEHSRRFSGSINFKGLFYLTFLNVPKSFYDIIDLIMLITSISFFISLSKTSELIIVRASGRSIYQTLSAPFFVSLIIGCVIVSLFNPIVASSSKAYLNMKEQLLQGGRAIFSVGSEGLWLRQGINSQNSVIRATLANVDASTLYGITMISFSENGSVFRLIEAESANILENSWQLQNAKIWPIGPDLNSEKKAKFYKTFSIVSNITKEEITERFGEPHLVSIWNLPSYITQLRAVGFSMRKYEVRYHSELSHPIFLAAMMLVGCAFTMKKFIGNRKSLAVVASILLGFGFFYVRNLAELLAEGNQLNLIAATWIPAFSSIFISLGLILHMEDG